MSQALRILVLVFVTLSLPARGADRAPTPTPTETPVAEATRLRVPARVRVDEPFLQRLLEGATRVAPPPPPAAPDPTASAPPRTFHVRPVPYTNPTPSFIFRPLVTPAPAVPQLSPAERRAGVERFRQAAAGKKRAVRERE